MDTGAGIGSLDGAGVKDYGHTMVGDTPRSAASTIHSDSIKSAPSSTPRTKKPHGDDFEIEEASQQQRDAAYASDTLFQSDKLDTVKSHHRNALRFVTNQQFAEAKEEFHRALELDPTNAPALSDLGVLHMMEQDLEMAEVCLTEALSYDPTHHGSRYNLGLLFHSRCEFDRAKDQFQMCLDANPKHTAAMYSLAQILSFQGNEKAAEELRDRAHCVQQMTQAGQ